MQESALAALRKEADGRATAVAKLKHELEVRQPMEVDELRRGASEKQRAYNEHVRVLEAALARTQHNVSTCLYICAYAHVHAACICPRGGARALARSTM